MLEEEISKIRDDFSKESEGLNSIIKEKDKDYSQKVLELRKENAVIQANLNVKDNEINRLRDNIRKYKAERGYRMKKDLEIYNNAIKKFKKELKETEFENQDRVKTGKSRVLISQKIDEAERIVSKLKLKVSTRDAVTIVDRSENIA